MDDELLIELASVDEVEAYIPTCKDQDSGMVPHWCELVLSVKREEGDFPLNTRLPLRRHDGELIVEVLHSALHPNAGNNAGDMIWRELDKVVDRIQRRVEKGKEPLKADVGRAQGLVCSLAILTNPYDPDEEAVRDAAMERYEIRTSARTGSAA